MRRTVAAGAAALGLLAAGCSGDARAEEVLVSAAASLTDAFTSIEAAFEAAHPDTDVVLNLGGSPALREQILGGAPADVFASASTATMGDVVEAGAAAGVPRPFARNVLQIVVPAGNPGRIAGLADFGNGEKYLGLCAEGVPCGDFAREALDRAGVTADVDTTEPDVRALLTKVAAGELDGGIVYATDVATAGDDVDGIEIPAASNVVATYPIVVVTDAPNAAGARAFVDFVLSEDGQALLSAAGFLAP